MAVPISDTLSLPGYGIPQLGSSEQTAPQGYYTPSSQEQVSPSLMAMLEAMSGGGGQAPQAISGLSGQGGNLQLPAMPTAQMPARAVGGSAGAAGGSSGIRGGVMPPTEVGAGPDAQAPFAQRLLYSLAPAHIQAQLSKRYEMQRKTDAAKVFNKADQDITKALANLDIPKARSIVTSTLNSAAHFPEGVQMTKAWNDKIDRRMGSMGYGQYLLSVYKPQATNPDGSINENARDDIKAGYKMLTDAFERKGSVESEAAFEHLGRLGDETMRVMQEGMRTEQWQFEQDTKRHLGLNTASRRPIATPEQGSYTQPVTPSGQPDSATPLGQPLPGQQQPGTQQPAAALFPTKPDEWPTEDQGLTYGMNRISKRDKTDYSRSTLPNLSRTNPELYRQKKAEIYDYRTRHGFARDLYHSYGSQLIATTGSRPAGWSADEINKGSTPPLIMSADGKDTLSFDRFVDMTEDEQSMAMAKAFNFQVQHQGDIIQAQRTAELVAKDSYATQQLLNVIERLDDVVGDLPDPSLWRRIGNVGVSMVPDYILGYIAGVPTNIPLDQIKRELHGLLAKGQVDAKAFFDVAMETFEQRLSEFYGKDSIKGERLRTLRDPDKSSNYVEVQKFLKAYRRDFTGQLEDMRKGKIGRIDLYPHRGQPTPQPPATPGQQGATQPSTIPTPTQSQQTQSTLPPPTAGTTQAIGTTSGSTASGQTSQPPITGSPYIDATLRGVQSLLPSTTSTPTPPTGPPTPQPPPTTTGSASPSSPIQGPPAPGIGPQVAQTLQNIPARLQTLMDKAKQSPEGQFVQDTGRAITRGYQQGDAVLTQFVESIPQRLQPLSQMIIQGWNQLGPTAGSAPEAMDNFINQVLQQAQQYGQEAVKVAQQTIAQLQGTASPQEQVATAGQDIARQSPQMPIGQGQGPSVSDIARGAGQGFVENYMSPQPQPPTPPTPQIPQAGSDYSGLVPMPQPMMSPTSMPEGELPRSEYGLQVTPPQFQSYGHIQVTPPSFTPSWQQNQAQAQTPLEIATQPSNLQRLDKQQIKAYIDRLRDEQQRRRQRR